MKLLDLCAGVGGFSYAAHRLGWETAAFCERDEYCQKVLAKNFPGVPIYDDVYTFPSEPFRGRIDVLAGGFPCQPFSQAGKRLGVNDERHLFPEMLRIIREVQPAWVVLENVNGLVTMALEVRDVKVGRTKYSRTEDIDDYEAIYTRTETMLLNSICEEIEREGYAVQPVIIPAVSLEADHERKRIWIVARRNDTDAERRGCSPNGIAGSVAGIRKRRQNDTVPSAESNSYGNVTNANHRERSGDEIGLRAKHSGTGDDDRDAANPDERSRQRGESQPTERPLSEKEGRSVLSDVADAESREVGAGLREARPVENGHQSGNGGRITPDAPDTRTARRQRQRQQTDDAGCRRCGSNLCRGCDGADRGGDDSNASNAASTRQRGSSGQILPVTESIQPNDGDPRNRRPANWYEAATRFCRVPDGSAAELDEPGARDNRVDRLKALGNMIYWPCAFEIFTAIEADMTEELRSDI